jgi:hypothetical protein
MVSLGLGVKKKVCACVIMLLMFVGCSSVFAMHGLPGIEDALRSDEWRNERFDGVPVGPCPVGIFNAATANFGSTERFYDVPVDYGSLVGEDPSDEEGFFRRGVNYKLGRGVAKYKSRNRYEATDLEVRKKFKKMYNPRRFYTVGGPNKRRLD